MRGRGGEGGLESRPRDVSGMFEGPVFGLLGRLSLPIFGGMTLQLLYGVVDTLWVSRIDPGDPSYVGGVGVVFPLVFLVIAVGSGILIGTGSLVARAVGSGDRLVLERVGPSGLAVALGAGALLLALGYGFDEEIVHALGARGDYARHALEYFRSMLPAGFLVLLGDVLIGILQGEGRMGKVMIAVLIGTAANIALDPVFIFLLGMGVRGAGLATVTAQLAAGAYMLRLFVRGGTLAPVRLGPRCVDGSVIRRILSVGLPQAAGHATMSASFLVYNRLIAGIDAQALAAFAVCGKFDQLLIMPILAIGSAEIAMIGQNYGRGNLARVARIWGACLFASAAAVSFLGILLFSLAPHLYSLFTEVDRVLSYAVRQTRVTVFSYVFASAAVAGRSFFQGLGRPFPGFVLDAVRLAAAALPVSLALVYLAGLGIRGIWLGIAAGNVVSAAAAVVWVSRSLKGSSRGISGRAR